MFALFFSPHFEVCSVGVTQGELSLRSLRRLRDKKHMHECSKQTPRHASNSKKKKAHKSLTSSLLAANNGHKGSVRVPYKHRHGLLRPPGRGKYRTNVYSLLKCTATRREASGCLQSVPTDSGFSGVWPSSARGNMLTAGLSDSQPVPPPCSRCFVNHSAETTGQSGRILGEMRAGKSFLLRSSCHQSDQLGTKESTELLCLQTNSQQQSFALPSSESFPLHA